MKSPRFHIYPLPVAGAVILALLLLAACASRYQMNVWLVNEPRPGVYERAKIDVEETNFAPNTRLNGHLETPNVLPGDRSTVIISLGMRGESLDRTGMDLALGFDQYLKYRIYLELPPSPITRSDTVALAENSFVRLMKFYELPPQEKTFLPVGETGAFIIDSIASGDLFGTFHDAFWENASGKRLGFEGRVKFKIR